MRAMHFLVFTFLVGSTVGSEVLVGAESAEGSASGTSDYTDAKGDAMIDIQPRPNGPLFGISCPRTDVRELSLAHDPGTNQTRIQIRQESLEAWCPGAAELNDNAFTFRLYFSTDYWDQVEVFGRFNDHEHVFGGVSMSRWGPYAADFIVLPFEVDQAENIISMSVPLSPPWNDLELRTYAGDCVNVCYWNKAPIYADRLPDDGHVQFTP